MGQQRLKKFTFSHLDKTIYVTVYAPSAKGAWKRFSEMYSLTYQEYFLLGV